MIKKIIMMFCLFMFSHVPAQDPMDQINFDMAFQELLYEMGMNLAQQDLIVDSNLARQAVINLYNQVDDFHEIVDLFMMIDEELVQAQITTIQDLIDYHVVMHNDIAQAFLAWLVAYQQTFIIFIQIHGSNASFIDWCSDIMLLSNLEQDQELQDPLYQDLLQACCYTLQIQVDLELLLEDLE